MTAFSPPFEADQPGGSWTVFPNTTTTQVQYRNGHLVTAMASGLPPGRLLQSQGPLYQVDVSGGTPVLLQQGIIDPGPGVAVQMPSVAEDINGNLGFSWMEASSSEYLSMWVGTLDTQGHFSSLHAAPGGGFFESNFRIGDYSSIGARSDRRHDLLVGQRVHRHRWRHRHLEDAHHVVLAPAGPG